MKRGFTLTELVTVIATVSVVFAAGSALYLEGRAGVARHEAQVNLQRQASLAAEWISRDLRAAAVVTPGENSLAADETVFSVENGRLFRGSSAGADKQIVARGVMSLNAVASELGWTVSLVLERPLLAGRSQRISRQFFVGKRR